jgi:hypothetical protein
MSELSISQLQYPITTSVKKSRGRPKGSKNKPKPIQLQLPEVPVKRPRGRPKGSKNKKLEQDLCDNIDDLCQEVEDILVGDNVNIDEFLAANSSELSKLPKIINSTVYQPSPVDQLFNVAAGTYPHGEHIKIGSRVEAMTRNLFAFLLNDENVKENTYIHEDGTIVKSSTIVRGAAQIDIFAASDKLVLSLEEKLNLSLDSQKGPAACERILNTKRLLEKAYPGKKIIYGFLVPFYSKKDIIKSTKKNDYKGVPLYYMKDILRILGKHISRGDYDKFIGSIKSSI